MNLVVTISLFLFITSSLSYSDGLNSTNFTLEDREISKALLTLSLGANVDFDFPNKGDLHHYSKEGYNGIRQTRLLNVLDMFLGGLEKIQGFKSMILDFASMFGIYLEQAPKYSIDDVMNQVNTQFADVKSQLSVIYNKMLKQDIDAYRAVEDAITAANSDIKLNSTLDLTSRGLRLYDQLNIFSRGMLGQNGLSADILQATTDLLKCASTSIYNQMQKYINLVNIGGLGLGYYGKRIGENFNLNARAKDLDDMKSLILKRTNTFMSNCQVVTVAKVNSYITNILNSMQNSNAKDVAQALNSYLDDIYTQKFNFVFYIAQNFDSSTTTAMFGYWALVGLRGTVANGVWTVYWAATLTWPKNDVQQLNVDNENILKTLTNFPATEVFNANSIYRIIKGSAVAFSGRPSSLIIVVVYDYRNSPSPASVSNSHRLNTHYNRFSVKRTVRMGFAFALTTWAIDIVVQ